MASQLNTVSANSETQDQLQDGGFEKQPRWNLAARVFFRFLFAFMGLMCVNIFLVVIQITIYFSTGRPPSGGFVEALWRFVVPRFGRYVLGLHGNINFNGRGDSAFDWVMIALSISLAVVATLVWSILDRNRPSYARLHQWLRVAVRLALAGAMIIYGTDKVFPLQFGTLGLSRLTTPIGDLNPEAMLWAFMAASTGYTIFAGLGELLSAVLLIVPRFANLGAIVVIAVMTNVFAMNVFYDVPVKIYSFLYLMMGVFLLAPEVRRLADVLVFNRTVQPANHPSLFRRQRMNAIAATAQLLTGGLFLAVCLYATHGLYVKRQQLLLAKPPLYGIWMVGDFVATGNPSVLAYEKQWHRMIFERPGGVVIESNGGEDHQVKLDLNSRERFLTLTRPADPQLNATLHFEQPQPTELVLDGDLSGNKIHVVLHRVDESKFPLTSTEIHFIQ